ncbi:importin subunit beta-1-like [Dendronephthya gigantea]|uniref:importin subunit beta-1-like n=1 Tax=Dendronephthya gigantea TaxID=151771 RepID=UPI00106C2CA4|nr:importin subunit beta-1-like [Dendronephthya gigantea]
MELSTILEATVSQDKVKLDQAEKFLQDAAQNNLPQFLVALAIELVDSSKSQVCRMAAALQLKNQLTSKDDRVKLAYQQRWLGLEDTIKNAVKTRVVATLGTESTRPAIGPQCIAAIACTELPVQQWPDLIPTLVQNVTNGTATESLKEQTLEAIGYICQDIDPKHLAMEANSILTAIVQGMRKEEPSDNVRLAATTALYNSLEFTKGNFDKENERHFIMQVVCEATQCTNTQVKIASLQNLVKIMSLYYDHMVAYMGPALFAISLDAIKSDIPEVSLQGIEFWSTVCDEEIDLDLEAEEAAQVGQPPERSSKKYAKGALQYLVPLILETLCKQEEFDDEDDWNPSKAAGVCLMLLAQCCENDVVPYVLPFVESTIGDEMWQRRDAAVMAFGSVLGGPDPEALKHVVVKAMPLIIELMHDPSTVVRDSAAWTVGRVCELLPDEAINPAYLNRLLEQMLTCLSAEPRVAANSCWAFSSLAEAALENAKNQCGTDEPNTFALSESFTKIINDLFIVTNRPDGNQANLRSAAYEAIMEMIKNSPKDCYMCVQSTTLVILERLQQVLQLEGQITSTDDRSQYIDLQALICATLQSVLRKVEPDDALKISDAVMSALLQLLITQSGQGGGAKEDALLAVAILVEVIGVSFMKYMEAFKPMLTLALRNTEEHQACIAAVGIVGDLCRAFGEQVSPFCDEFMKLLMENLANQTVHRSVKPQVISALGDIALAIGANFVNYLEPVMLTLEQAASLQIETDDYDTIDYLNELREACLEAYTGIIQGFKGDGNVPSAEVQNVWPSVPSIVTFLEKISVDKDHSEAVVAAACGLVGDMCSAFGTPVQQHLEKPTILELLQEGRRSKGGKTKSVATWATKELRKLKQA